MIDYRWTALVTLVALLVYLWMGIQAGVARGKAGIAAPAMTGDPQFERAVRVQMNTLEWLPLYLASLWLFAASWNDKVAAGIGLVWIVGRVLYATGYRADPAKRSTGFLIQALTVLVLLLGALGKVVCSLATGA